jgi:chromosomal replication initiator protein
MQELGTVDAQEAWDLAYSQLELQLDRANFDTWLRGASLLRLENGVFVIGVRNSYARDMLQHRLYRNVWRVLSDVWGEKAEIRFEIAPHAPKFNKGQDTEMPLFRLLAEQSPEQTAEASNVPLYAQIARPEQPTLPESELNPRFTFDRFIVSNANRMSYEAARAVAENPGRYYNPFLVYGGVGLGKTHLLQSIAQVCQNKGLRTVYVPSEAFTNDLVASIRQKTTAMFREKYRSADVLLVDDIQFISGKDGTQEEFFHTFNALVMYNKQVVLASDRHPRELTTLEDRLRSRFAAGLVVDIPPLEFETRYAILEMWVHERGVNLPKNVIETVAGHVNTHVRELEGVFNQIVAMTTLSHRTMTVDVVETILQRFGAPRPHGRQKITLHDVIEVTAKFFNLKAADLIGKARMQRINEARQVAMYLARELTDASLPQIGEAFGGRSHTTVLHGCNKMVEALDYDPSMRHSTEKIRSQLVGS